MFTFIKYLLVLTLFLVCSVIVCLFAYFALAPITDIWAVVSNPRTLTDLQITAVALLILLPVSFAILFLPLFRITEEQGCFGRLIRAALIILMLAFLGYQLFDDRKVFDRYSAKDLIFNHPENGKATFLASSLVAQKLGSIPDTSDLAREDYFKTITAHRDEIADFWKRIAPYRLVIDQLSELAVLPHPALKADGGQTYYDDLVGLRRIYLAYILLQVEDGREEEAINQLIKFHRVARNGFAGSYYLLEKMTWSATLERTLKTAYQIAINSNIPARELNDLYAAFPALTFEEASMYKVWLTEYLAHRDRLSASADQVLAAQAAEDFSRPPLLLQLTPRWLFVFYYRLTFQLNRTARVLQSYWEPAIDAAKARLPSLQNAGFSLEEYGVNPPLRNLSGWYFHRPQSFTTQEQEVVSLKRTSELLVVYLKSRVEPGAAIGSYLGDELKQVEIRGNSVVAAGSDGAFDTGDDVRLDPLY